MELAPSVTLLHGAEMPILGLGTWPMNDGEAERVVAEAIGVGYRLIDTAHLYNNEQGVGRGLRSSGVPRDDLFVTSKLARASHGRDLVPAALDRSLDALGLDYLDLMLIHWPNPEHGRYVEAWQGLVDLFEAGRLRAIGVSNFKPVHLDRLLAETGVVPDVNQIELNPALTRTTMQAYHAEHGIVTESYSPIGGQGAGVGLLDNPAVTGIAEELGRTPAQVVLRWHLEQGLVPVPKTSNRERLRENLDVFGFSLTLEQVASLSALDQGEAAAFDADLISR